MEELADKTRYQLVFNMLLEALRVEDEQLNDVALELFSRLDAQAMPPLVREALNTKNRPAHRVRILQALGRMGRFEDIAAYLDLHLLLHDRSKSVRQAARELLGLSFSL